MRLIFTALSAVCAVYAANLVAGEPEQFDWRRCAPEDQGMASARLEAMKLDLAARRTDALLVIRNDALLMEWYADGRQPADKHGTASLAKAVVGGLSLALAVDDGPISLDDQASQYIPEWQNDSRKSKILVRHLGSHTSGIKDAWVAREDANGINQSDFSGWEGEFWRWRSRRKGDGQDAFTIARDLAPVLFEPGGEFHYSNPGIALLTYCVTASLKGQKHQDVRTLLHDRIMQPIGVPDDEWSCGYERTEVVDGLPLVPSWGGGAYSPRAIARIGRLVLNEGRWKDRQLVSPRAVQQMTSDAGFPGHCGMGWWTNRGGRYPKLPRDAVWGAGAGHQLLFVVPSLDLIVVRMGGILGKTGWPGDFEEALEERFVNPLMATFTDGDARRDLARRSTAAPAYRQSLAITGIEWAPAKTIVRKAKGSDNWPLTWADDGNLYGPYGDGNGFEPYTETKLSLGFAQVAGNPDDFQGLNVRAPTLERLGQGRHGMKASGILMVEGTLYLWVRNAANSQLAWSADHGLTWTWADWKFTTSFGCPTFLNFGKNYAGARDEFVYVYSLDSNSAYDAADRMVLARVPKGRILDRDAYEFFVRLNAQSVPEWSTNIGDRGAVFHHPEGRCYRSGISYNAGLRRYLWCQTLPGDGQFRDKSGDPRFQGGFGIYDAPEPWGPWTTVYFTESWDVGPGETSLFPTKWMSADGRTLHLVFSGDDCFSVRQARLTVVDAPDNSARTP